MCSTPPAARGSFLPWLAELVGPSGALTALDLARDNVALVERRMQGWDLPCPVEVQAGTVLALPYPDASFDAVWLANSSQYLTDDELATTLAEFRRVVRPGGLVAIKDSDGELSRLAPGPPGVALPRLRRLGGGRGRCRGGAHARPRAAGVAPPGGVRRGVGPRDPHRARRTA